MNRAPNTVRIARNLHSLALLTAAQRRINDRHIARVSSPESATLRVTAMCAEALALAASASASVARVSR